MSQLFGSLHKLFLFLRWDAPEESVVIKERKKNLVTYGIHNCRTTILSPWQFLVFSSITNASGLHLQQVQQFTTLVSYRDVLET